MSSHPPYHAISCINKGAKLAHLQIVAVGNYAGNLECKHKCKHAGYLQRMETIGERIQRLREAKGLSRSDLAYTIKISPQGMAAIENGETKSPSFPVGLKIARALDVSAWEIAFGKPEPRRSPPLENNQDPGDLLSSLPFPLENASSTVETPTHEERLTRLERYATVHYQVLNHVLHTSQAADRLPNLLERVALLVPGSEALVEEIRTLRESP